MISHGIYTASLLRHTHLGPSTQTRCLLSGCRLKVCLQAAAAEPQSLDRLLLVTAFSVSAYSGVKRTQKPCNAFLGETFEYSCPEKGFRFLAEKVSLLTLSCLRSRAEVHPKHTTTRAGPGPTC